MSYINDALKKAQKERDSRYGHFGGIIAPCADRSGRPRGKRIVPGLAVALVLVVSTALLAVFFTERQPLSGEKETPAPVVAGPPAAPGGPQALQETEIRYKEALLAQRKGDPRAAEDLYLKVLALDPGHVRALNNLGVLCLAQKRREKAIALFSKAIVLKSDYVDPYYNLA